MGGDSLDGLYTRLEELTTNLEVESKLDVSAEVFRPRSKLMQQQQPQQLIVQWSKGEDHLVHQVGTPTDMVQLNAQALKVWNQVKVKLERLEGRKSVDELIKQATDPERLALLYEGWTSWV